MIKAVIVQKSDINRLKKGFVNIDNALLKTLLGISQNITKNNLSQYTSESAWYQSEE